MTNWVPKIDRSSRPLYLAIADAIAQAIEARTLSPGAKLPTHRDLAYRLNVSIQTVSAAYREAEQRDLVVGEIGRGTFVRPQGLTGKSGYIMERRQEDLIDLSISRPVSGYVHTEAVHAAFAAMARNLDPAAMTACRPILGLDSHRAAGREWVAQHGLPCDAGQLVICNGAAHGIMLAMTALTRPGDVVATDGLADHGLILLANTLHLRLKALASDRHGVTPKGFEEACQNQEIKVLFVIPTLNNPTASIMTAERRRVLAEIAKRYGVAIVEDDPYGALLRSAPPPLCTFVPELGYYVTTFTKCLMPGLRTGYLVAPHAAIPRLTSRLRATSWMGTPLIAEIAMQWIGDGTAQRLIAWQRDELDARQEALERILRRFDLTYHRHALFAWLTVTPQWRVDNFVAVLRQRGIAVTPAEVFVVGQAPAPHAVRLSLGATRSRAQLEQGLTIIAETLKRDPEPVLADH